MEAYTDFASVYDVFMDETPYEMWFEFLHKKLIEYGITDGLILDIGCGTGKMTRLFSNAGYDMIGIDNSDDMIRIAMENENTDSHILYLLQDMREFELYGTVGAVISVCDCVNYVLEEDELEEVFRLVNNYLDPDGIFIFDFNTEYKYREVIGETVIAENREDCSFIWENYYDEEEEINQYDLTIFVKENDLYRKFEETHYQRGYTFDLMKQTIEKSGLQLIEAMDVDTGKQVTSTSERIYMICKEYGKGSVK